MRAKSSGGDGFWSASGTATTGGTALTVPSISVGVPGTLITEGVAGSFNVSMLVPAGGVTVNLDITTSGDFGVSAGRETLTFDASDAGGNISISFDVPTVGDSVSERNGSVTATIAAGDGYSVPASPNNSATITILDDDSRGVTVTPASLPVGEGRTAAYTVVLDNTPTGNVTVTPTSGDTTAVTVSGALTFTTSNWSVAQTVTLTGVEDDDAVSEAVTITHAVTGGGYGSVTAPSVTATTIDDEAAVMAWIDSPTVREDGDLTFTVSLNRHPVTANPRVYYRLATDPGTSEDSDHRFSASDVIMRSTSETFTVRLNDDDRPEFDETIRVELYTQAPNPTNATIAPGGSIGVGTIVDDDDSVVAITSTDVDIRESESLRISVTLNPAGDRPVTVDYATAAAGVMGVPDAVAGTHYTALQGTLTFAADETEEIVTLQSIHDNLYDVDRFLAVDISNATGGATIVTARNVVQITNRDEFPIVMATGPTVAENEGPLVFNVTLHQASAQTVTMDYADALTGSATSGTDYTAVTPGRLTFLPGETGKIIEVALIDDALAGEGRETVQLSISNVMNADITGNEILYGAITENDIPLVLDTATPDVTLQVGRTHTVNLAEIAYDADTYTASSSHPNIASTLVSGSGFDTIVTITAHAEGVATISAVVSLGDSSLTDEFLVTVTPQPVISITAVSPSVLESAGAGFTLTADPAPSTAITVNLTITQTGNYVAAGNLGAKTVAFAANQATATYSVPTVDDMIVAANGTVTATLATGTNYTRSTTQRAASVTVVNDTRGVIVSASGTGVTVAEGGTAVYTVVLTNQPTGNVTVTPSSGALAVARVSGALTFTPSNWNAAKTVTVTGVDDSIVNPGRSASITHSVSGGGYDGVSAASVAVTVTDNDTRGVTVDPTALSVSEGAGSAYTVRLTSQPTGSVTVTPSTSDTAVARVSGALIFAAGNWNTTQPVTVTGVDDGDDDLDAVRMATISHTVSGGDYGSVTAADVTVTVRQAGYFYPPEALREGLSDKQSFTLTLPGYERVTGMTTKAQMYQIRGDMWDLLPKPNGLDSSINAHNSVLCWQEVGSSLTWISKGVTMTTPTMFENSYRPISGFSVNAPNVLHDTELTFQLTVRLSVDLLTDFRCEQEGVTLHEVIVNVKASGSPQGFAQAVGTIPDVGLQAGFSRSFNVKPYFGPARAAFSYQVESVSPAGVANVTLSGTDVVVDALADGEATVTLRASSGAASAVQMFSVVVGSQAAIPVTYAPDRGVDEMLVGLNANVPGSVFDDTYKVSYAAPLGGSSYRPYQWRWEQLEGPTVRMIVNDYTGTFYLPDFPHGTLLKFRVTAGQNPEGLARAARAACHAQNNIGCSGPGAPGTKTYVLLFRVVNSGNTGELGQPTAQAGYDTSASTGTLMELDGTNSVSPTGFWGDLDFRWEVESAPNRVLTELRNRIANSYEKGAYNGPYIAYFYAPALRRRGPGVQADHHHLGPDRLGHGGGHFKQPAAGGQRRPGPGAGARRASRPARLRQPQSPGPADAGGVRLGPDVRADGSPERRYGGQPLVHPAAERAGGPHPAIRADRNRQRRAERFRHGDRNRAGHHPAHGLRRAGPDGSAGEPGNPARPVQR